MGVMHTMPEVGIDQYQFMKLESEGAARYLKTLGIRTLTRAKCMEHLTKNGEALKVILTMFVQDECTIPGAYIGGVATAPRNDPTSPEQSYSEARISLRPLLRTVKRKTQREMQQLARNLGLRLAWRRATRTKDPTKPAAIITPFMGEYPAPLLQEDIISLIVGELDPEAPRTAWSWREKQSEQRRAGTTVSS